MHPTKSFGVLALAAALVNARPAPQLSRGLFDDVAITDDLIVFDAPAFPDPLNPANTLVALQSFVSLRTIDLGAVATGVTAVLSSLGIDVGDSIDILQDRIRLIGAIGLPGKSTTISVPGCDATTLTTAESSGLPDLGLGLKTQALGKCSGLKAFVATADLGTLDTRKVSASIFSSPDSGFGVISDIDDTVKISNVLDKVALLKNTFLEDPQPVPGMPELYSSLASSLNDPQFVYVTGSPFQLYPFLNSFLDTTYSASQGPILMQNLTIVDPSQAIQFLTNGTENTQDFKTSMIDRLNGMYPNKKWLAIGDSTQRDPEVYGEAIRKFGDKIACAWIRRFDGANNTDERFAAAFDGVPSNRFRIYTDDEIPGLAKIDVAGGNC